MNESKNKVASILEKFNNGDKQKSLNEIEFLLNSDDKNIDLFFIHAKMLINLNKLDKSNISLLKILSLEPNNITVLELIYTNFLKINNYEVAEKYINKLLKIGNNKYELLRDKAFIEYLKKNYLKSEGFIKKALQINNDEVFGINILGLLKIEQNKTLEAVQLFEKAIYLNPNYTDSYNNIGKCLIDLEDLSKAYQYFKKAYKIKPNSDLPIINIANILSLKDKNKLAIKFYEKAKKINPNNRIVDENIAICNCRLKNLTWVEENFQKQKKLNDFHYEFVLGYSYLLLNKKRFSEAFDLFDARLKTKDFPKKNINHHYIINKLNTQNIIKPDNKILIIKEQGVGDEILFSTMYNEIINYCSNIKFECDYRLVKIFNRSFNKNIFFPFGHFSSSKKRTEKFEKVIYAGSLTKYFRKNENDFKIKPYLKSLKKIDDKINFKLNSLKNTKKIGISWKSVINIYGSLKSLKIENFEKIFCKNRSFINLQYGDVDTEIEEFKKKGKHIYNFTEIDLFNDFESLISLLKSLDIFVTVSNSTAHFAGALGVPTILICPKKSSTYYYWDYEDGKTPWYDSVSIIKFDKSIDYTMSLVNDLIESI